ncbi:hypothetical protein [Campylobacter concisus]|uniref:hypothetical protein n=1 Tax=Campylobacter concisus TaxID=199 RepID=UPI00131E60FB|nr:hypothetical protein [Campylobacter concisus]
MVNLFKIANEIYASASFIAMIALFSAVHSIFFNNKKEYFLAAFIIFVVLYFVVKVVVLHFVSYKMTKRGDQLE